VTWQILASFAAAAVLAVVTDRLGVPGGAILGAMVGAAAVTLVAGREVDLPPFVQTSALVVIGATIGVQITRQSIAQLAGIIGPAVLAAILIIACGVGIAIALSWVGLAPPEHLLATSPGALSVIAGVAVDRGEAPVEVAIFHLVRVVLVVLTLPVILAIAARIE
jgi:uncharacterized protein